MGSKQKRPSLRAANRNKKAETKAETEAGCISKKGGQQAGKRPERNLIMTQFTGKILTLAELQRLAGDEPLSTKALDSWNYFMFENHYPEGSVGAELGWHGWRAVLSGTDAIIVTDESCDLNMASVFPDAEGFIYWLEETYEERQAG